MAEVTRMEHDFLGEKEIPVGVYYGVQTIRALENFKITDIPISIEPKFIQALGYVKKAAAMANMDLGVLPEDIFPLIQFPKIIKLLKILTLSLRQYGREIMSLPQN